MSGQNPDRPVDSPGEAPAPVEISGTFFSEGASRGHLQQLSLLRSYRPKQRTSLKTSDGDDTPTVPAGWKADPTDRHQFRYWDGFCWTESVADDGEQGRDPVDN